MNTISSNNYRDAAFPDIKTFNKIYEECLENAPMASDNVRKSYNEIGRCFEEYLSAIQEDMFRYAYECGYEAGRREGKIANG